MPQVRTTGAGTVMVKLSGAEVKRYDTSKKFVAAVCAAVASKSGIPGAGTATKLVVGYAYEQVRETNGQCGGEGAVVAIPLGRAAAATTLAIPFPLLAAPVAALAAKPSVLPPDKW